MKIKDLAVALQGTIEKQTEVKVTIPQAEEIVKELFTIVKEQIKQGEKVNIHGFGTFEARERAARKGRNPQTGEEMEIAATVIPAYKPSPTFKKEVKEYN
jgi:DNA-binding protein HU-beta